MKKSDFHYELPAELIASEPLPERSDSRLLVVPGQGGFADRRFRDVVELLAPGDLLVFNDTRVIPARLYGRKDTGGRVEVMLERMIGQHEAIAQLGVSKAPQPGSRIELEGGGAFEVLGYPVGFDYVALSSGETSEMGSEVPVGSELRITAPRVQGLDPKADKPEIVVRLLRAVESGWELMDEGSKSLAFQTTEPGAYRAEVRIRPRHLLAQLSSYAELAEKSFVWIYSNPIYVK